MKTKQTKAAAGSIRKSGLGVVGLVLATALSVAAGEPGQASDDLLRRAAQESVRTNPYLGVFDHVLVDTEGGRVWLRGSVEQRHRRAKVAASIARLSGVLEIRNEIEVQSSAPDDVSLRRRLFERLYFGGEIDAGQRPEWPVRILVSDGRVTFAGELASSAECERLETIALNAGAQSVATRFQAQAPRAHLAAAGN